MMSPSPNFPPSESDTIALFRKGNKEAFGHLYDRYSPLLYGLVCRIAGSTELAEKILADTFVQISNNRLSYDEKKESICSWMIKYARATALSAMKKRKEAENTGTEPNISWDNSMELNHFVLSDSYESEDKVLELMYVHGKTSQELCQLFKTNPEIIIVKLKRALNRLKAKEVV